MYEGSVHPRPSFEALEKELKEEKIREEIIACRIEQRRMIEEQVRREMEIGHEGSFPSVLSCLKPISKWISKISNATFKYLRPEHEDLSGHLAKSPLFSSIETSVKHALVKEDSGYSGSILTAAGAANKPECLKVPACSEKKMEILDQKLTTTEKTANTKISNVAVKFLRPEQEDLSSHLAKAPLFSSIETSVKHALVEEDRCYSGSILTAAVAANMPERMEVPACGEKKMEILDQKLTTTKRTANTKISNATFTFLRPEQEDLSSHLAKAPRFSSIATSVKHALVKEDSGYSGSILTAAIAANKPERIKVPACCEKKVNIQVNGKLYEVVENGIYLWCSLCKVQCINQDIMANHLSGKKHLKKEWRKGNKTEAAESEAVEEKNNNVKEVNKNWICDLCQVELPGKRGLSDHLIGKKHLAKSAHAHVSNELPKSAAVETSVKHALDKEDSGYCGSILTAAVTANKPECMEVPACSEKKMGVLDQKLTTTERTANTKISNATFKFLRPEPEDHNSCLAKAPLFSSIETSVNHELVKEDSGYCGSILTAAVAAKKLECMEVPACSEKKREVLDQKLTTTKRTANTKISNPAFPFLQPEQGDRCSYLAKAPQFSSIETSVKHALVKEDSGYSGSILTAAVAANKPERMKVPACSEKKVNIQVNGKLYEVVENGIYLWCSLCKVQCINRDVMADHLSGKKHLKKEWRKGNKTEAVESEGVEEENNNVKEVNKKWICDLCQVELPGKRGLSDHLIGKKHLAKSAHAHVSNELPKSAAVEGNNGPSAMLMDTQEGTKASTNVENLSLLKKEALEEKYHVKNVNNIWICDLCQVNVPSPDHQNFNVHFKGKKHQAKLIQLSVISELENSAAVEDNNGPSSMPTDIHVGTKVSIYTEEEKLSLLKKALEEKYHVKEVNNIWICNLCKVAVPRPDGEGFKDHLRGKKHQAKLEPLSAINEPAKSAALENDNCRVGSSSMPIDIQEGNEVSMGVENSSLVKKEAIEEGKYYVNEVNESLISHLCQVEVPGGKKHQVKTVQLNASTELSNSVVKGNNGCSGSSSLPIDTHGGLKESREGEGNLSLVKKEATEEEKYIVKEVTKNWICDLCQVSVPRPGTEGFNAHLSGRKHRVKSISSIGSSLIQTDTKISNRG